MHQHSSQFQWIVWIVAMVLVGMILLPLMPLIGLALGGSATWPEWFPVAENSRLWITLQEQSGTWLKAVGMSIAIAATVTGINLIIAWPAADALVRRQMIGKKTLRALFYAPLLLPAFVPLMGIHFQFVQFGLHDQFLGVVFAHLLPTFPYLLRSLMIGFATLGMQWEEQAQMLGADRWQRLRVVVFPIMKPAIFAGCALSMLVSFSQYVITLIIGGGQVKTLPVVMFPYLNGGDPATAAQLVILFVLVNVLLMWGLQYGLGIRQRQQWVGRQKSE